MGFCVQRANESSELQRSRCLAEGNRSRETRVSTDAEVSLGREVWISRSNAARSNIDPIESRQGSGAAYNWRVCPVHLTCGRIRSRTQHQLILGVELRFCDSRSAAPAFELIHELRRMLNGLRRKLVARQ
jgi:hypothetical protein